MTSRQAKSAAALAWFWKLFSSLVAAIAQKAERRLPDARLLLQRHPRALLPLPPNPKPQNLNKTTYLSSALTR
jgi:hypothetical protein